jgi:2-furoyl-CoA dehydrogenase large subunit
MSSEGLERARAKMSEAGIDPVAIETFAHYYRLLEHGETGMIPESSIEPVDSESLDDVEIDDETGDYEFVDYAAVDDCGTRINPQIVEGQVHGALAHGLGAATYEIFEYDEDGNLLTPNFYDYHVPHALDMPPVHTDAIESPSPFTPLGAKGMGEGGGAPIHAVSAAIQDALRAAGGAIVTRSNNPPHRVWELIRDPSASRGSVGVESR